MFTMNMGVLAAPAAGGGGGGGGGAFTPNDLPSIILWLDADDPATITFSSGSNVNEWFSKAPGARKVSITGGTPYTKAGLINGRDTITGNNSGQYVLNSSFALTNGAYSIFAVVKTSVSSLLIGSNSSGAYALDCESGQLYAINSSGSFRLLNDARINNGNTHMYGVIADISGQTGVYLDDSDFLVGSASNGILVTGVGNYGFGLGFSGQIAEIVICQTNNLNPAQIASLRSYFKTKWNY